MADADPHNFINTMLVSVTRKCASKLKVCELSIGSDKYIESNVMEIHVELLCIWLVIVHLWWASENYFFLSFKTNYFFLLHIRKFPIVSINYFTKWIEVEPLATVTSKRIEEIVWKDIIFRFGLPRVLVANYRKKFDSDAFRRFYEILHIHLSLASVSDLQANG